MTRGSPPGDRDTTAEATPSVTVVVATKNAGRTIEACLRSIRSQSFPCQLVVVDNSSSDATPEIARRLADAVITRGPERSAQRNSGARSFPADIVGFIDADMVLEPTVVEEAVAAISTGAAGAVVPERTVGSGFWVEVRAYERSFYAGCDSVEAARFFRWDVFERTGGFDENLTGPEDWDLSEAAAKLGTLARTTACILHDEGTLSYLDACRKKAYYAEGLRRYVAKRGLAAARHATDRPWLRQPRALLNRHGGGMLALKAGESVAVAAALMVASVGRLPERARLHGVVQAAVSAGTAHPAVAHDATSPSQWARLGRRLDRARLGLVWSLRICQTMRHRARTLAHIGLGFLAPTLAGDVTFETRTGLLVVAPAADYGWWAVAEVVVADCYRLASSAPLLPSRSQIVDIGGHVGAFSLLAAALLPDAHVTTFEPSKLRTEYLQRNIHLNGFEGRITVVPAAVGGTRAQAQLVDMVLTSPTSPVEGEFVEVLGIEEAAAKIDGPIHLLKMDCEGGEYEIVAGASEATLRRIERLVLEYHPALPRQQEQLFRRLQEVGFGERWRSEAVAGQLGVVYFDRSRS